MLDEELVCVEVFRLRLLCSLQRSGLKMGNRYQEECGRHVKKRPLEKVLWLFFRPLSVVVISKFKIFKGCFVKIKGYPVRIASVRILDIFKTVL